MPSTTALRPLLWALTLTTLAPCLHAQQDKEQDEAQAQLAFVRQLPYQGAWPALTGFSAAQPVKGFQAPAGDHGHTQAYRSAAGCVAFFFPIGEDGVADVALKWEGPACNGQPVQGKGALQIRRRAGDKTVVGTLQGTFVQGALAGDGVKANFTYDQAGQPVPGVYLFQGHFANSVLHGEGMQRWSGAADARPSAWALRGQFEHGTIRGPVSMTRLRPYPGVEAQAQALHYADNGNSYIAQAQVNGGALVPGTLFFERDPIPWKAEVAVWRDEVPEAARFTRTDLGRHHVMIAGCMQWRFEDARLACGRGNVSAGGAGGVISTDEGDFGIRLPLPARVATFQPGPATALRIGLDNAEMPARCDAELSRCTGTGPLPIRGSLTYWHGDIEWRDGALRPVSASLYQQPAPPQAPRMVEPNEDEDEDEDTGADNNEDEQNKADSYEQLMRKAPFDPGKRDTRIASCESFASPVECSRGQVFWSGRGHFAGAWRYDGVTYRSDAGAPPRYVAQGQQRMARLGWGTNTFSNGSWAEVRYDRDGDIAEVGKCDDPGRSDTFRCRLEGNTVMFSGDRSRQSRPQREATAPVYTPPAYHQGGGRFMPPVVPQRPVYVLPGMR